MKYVKKIMYMILIATALAGMMSGCTQVERASFNLTQEADCPSVDCD